MGTIAEKLTYTLEAKEDIKNAIVDKGVDVPSSATLKQYGDLIEEIQGGGGEGYPPVITKAEFVAGTGIKVSTDTLMKSSATASNFVVTLDDEPVEIGSASVTQGLAATLGITQSLLGGTIKVKVLRGAFQYTHSDSRVATLTVDILDTLMGSREGMTDHNFSSDDGSQSYSIPSGIWKYGSDVTSITVSGNSNIGFNGTLVNFNNRDNYVSTYLTLETELENNIKVHKCRWEGWAPYNNRSDAYKYIWELYLFSTGDAMVYLAQRGASATMSGYYSFLGNAYNAPSGAVSFYRLDAAGNEWEIDYNKYDPSKSRRLM